MLKGFCFLAVSFLVLSYSKLQDHQYCQDLCIAADCLESWDLQAKASFPVGVSLNMSLPPLFLDHLVGKWYVDEFKEPG